MSDQKKADQTDKAENQTEEKPQPMTDEDAKDVAGGYDSYTPRRPWTGPF